MTARVAAEPRIRLVERRIDSPDDPALAESGAGTVVIARRAPGFGGAFRLPGPHPGGGALLFL